MIFFCVMCDKEYDDCTEALHCCWSKKVYGKPRYNTNPHAVRGYEKVEGLENGL